MVVEIMFCVLCVMLLTGSKALNGTFVVGTTTKTLSSLFEPENHEP
jgi:hypothetical protein